MSEQTHEDVVNLFYEDEVAEPLEKPTEALSDETPEETEEESADIADDGTEESEELEGDELEESDDNEDTFVYEINGKEYTPEDIEALESGSMMQADYTKKTQAHAEEVKTFNDEKALFETDKAKVSDLSAQLEVLVAEDEEIDWADLKEYDPEKYIEQKEKADKRKVKLAEVKAGQIEQPKTQEAMTVSDQQVLFNANPQWLTDGRQDANNEHYVKDMQMLIDYGSTIGMSITDLQSMNKAGHWVAMLDAAKYQAQLKKGSALKKRVIKAPKVTKPKANNSTTAKSASDIMYGS
jgi:hypothetical protein